MTARFTGDHVDGRHPTSFSKEITFSDPRYSVCVGGGGEGVGGSVQYILQLLATCR